MRWLVRRFPDLTYNLEIPVASSFPLPRSPFICYQFHVHVNQRKMKPKRNGQHKRQADLASPGRLWHPDVPGPLWNGRRCVGVGQIEAYCRVVAREFQPRKIILFGSYATGAATPDSDVDLVVCLPFRGSATDKVVEIRGRVEAPFPLDLLVWRPAEEHKGNSFTRSILSEGKVMYEASHT